MVVLILEKAAEKSVCALRTVSHAERCGDVSSSYSNRMHNAWVLTQKLVVDLWLWSGCCCAKLKMLSLAASLVNRRSFTRVLRCGLMRVLRRYGTNAAPNAGSARVATFASGSAIAQDQQLAVLARTAVVVAAASREMRKINRARLSSGGGCNNSLVGALPLHTSESVSFIPRVKVPVCASAPEAHASSGG